MPVQFRVKTVLYIADDVIKQRDVLRKTLSEECLSVLNSSSPRRDPACNRLRKFNRERMREVDFVAEVRSR